MFCRFFHKRAACNAWKKAEALFFLTIENRLPGDEIYAAADGKKLASALHPLCKRSALIFQDGEVGRGVSTW